MALNIEALKEKSTTAFMFTMQDKVRFICTQAWESNLPTYLRRLNETIDAGRKLGVTTAEFLTEDEITSLATDLGPLRQLEMNDEVRALLLSFLQGKGLDLKIFEAEKK